jgi:Na+/melibiose symporter-like transporter
VDFVSADGIEAIVAIPELPLTGGKIQALSVKLNASKDEIRTSLKASTLDGVFAAVFSNVTGGVLLTNFFLEMNASPTQIGILASIPMLCNLLQPLGAYFSEKTTSRHYYCLWIYSISRSLWLGLAIAIFYLSTSHQALLIPITLGIALASSLLSSLGSASWLSWLAVLVPRQLRGRYFGFRNSAANLTNMISVPLTGLMASRWGGGSIQGYGIVLILAIGFGFISLGFQNYMVDVNPQDHSYLAEEEKAIEPNPATLDEPGAADFIPSAPPAFWRDSNFLKFLFYFLFWTFSVNLSAPFFNVYLLDELGLDLSHVTLYNSMAAGANLLMLMLWGKLADRIGNRPILLGVGIIFAVFPLLWLFTGVNSLSVWVLLPLLHCLSGGTSAAIELCSNNLQLGIAPNRNPSTYFGVAAAVAGISGALGTTAGGFFVQFGSGGLLGLFALSGILRLGALLPLVWVDEQQTV